MLIAFLLLTAGLISLQAYPPAPHHTLFGMVRNEWGDPIDIQDAIVFIQSTNGMGVAVGIAATTEPGVNYRMRVPMDAGITADTYQSTALREQQDFQLKVQIGSVTYVPIEMTFGPASLGQPAGTTRLDLTLGVDADGDGLPDAWEEAIIAMLGGDLEGISPEGDADGDGISNRDEYLAGTYAFDPDDGFRLALTGLTAGGSSTMEFFAVRGRTYRLEATSDLQQWFPVSFRVVEGEEVGPLRNDYLADEYRLLRIEVPSQAGAETNRYFRALLQ